MDQNRLFKLESQEKRIIEKLKRENAGGEIIESAEKLFELNSEMRKNLLLMRVWENAVDMHVELVACGVIESSKVRAQLLKLIKILPPKLRAWGEREMFKYMVLRP